MASSFSLVCTTILLALGFIAEAGRPSYFNYTTITGYFLQDEPSTDPITFDFTASNFGLIERAYPSDLTYDPNHKKTQWERFENHVFHLNRASGRDVQYKVLYLGRHGEGYHNVANGFYGDKAWNCYWAKLDGNGTAKWADARLTEKGFWEAKRNHFFWADRIANERIPVPENYYTSPLTRCLQTAQITFSGLDLPSCHPFIPQVKELLREGIGIHTCDRRGSKSYIHSAFPNYTFERNFSEADPLWNPDLRESHSAQKARLETLLDDIFTHDEGTFLSFTSHSGSIAALLRAIKHRKFRMRTGDVIPVLVKAERIDGERPSESTKPSKTAPACTANPTPSPGA